MKYNRQKQVVYSAEGSAYVPPRLVESKGKDGWYIIYWVTDVSTGELVRKRFFGISGTSIRDKKKSAREHIHRISTALAKGATVGIAPKSNSPELTLLKLYQIAEDIKRLEVERDGGNTHYLYRAKIFHEWLEETKLSKRPISKGGLSRKEIYQFMDFLTKEREVGAWTKNNYLAYISAASNKLIDRGYLEENPCTGIPRFKVRAARHVPFTTEQKEKLEKWMLIHDPELYQFTRMIYHGFIRRIEILRLKVSQVDLKNRIILLWTGNTKNKRQMPVVITPGLNTMLQELLADNPPGSWYLFGKGLKPGPNSYHPNRPTERHRKALEACEIDTSIHDLYGWKHTGVCAAYRAGVDIYSIMRQCRHSNLNETENYMRSMGLRISSELKNTDW